MLLPVENLTWVLAPVVHSLFADFQTEPQRILRAYQRIVRVLALVGFPLAAYLHFAAKELVVIFFGPQWLASVPVFEILAWSIGIQIVMSSSGPIFMSANQTKQQFIFGIRSSVLMIGAISYGVFVAKSLEGTGWALLVAFAINFIQCYYMLCKILQGSFWEFIGQFKWSVLIFLAVAGAEILLNQFYSSDQIFMSFVCKSITALLAFLAATFATGEYKTIWQFRDKSIKEAM